MSLIAQLNDGYRQTIDSLFKNHRPDEAASMSVGGGWEQIGATCMAAMVLGGLEPQNSVLDIGCGSGRLADQLHGWLTGRYIGLDVSGKLVKYAQKRFKGFEFVTTDGIKVDVPDGSVDMVSMFSVATHIPMALVAHYLRESNRVLKSGGAVVMSFLELAQPGPWSVMLSDLEQIEHLPHLNEFLHRDDLALLASHAELQVERIVDGSNACLTIPARARTRFPDLPVDPVAFGQSFVVLRRP